MRHPAHSPNLRVWLFTVMLLTGLITLLASLYFLKARHGDSVFALSNFIGPTTHSLLTQGDFHFQSDEIGTTGQAMDFRGARMPGPPMFLAMGVSLLGTDAILPNALLKAIVCLVVFWGATVCLTRLLAPAPGWLVPLAAVLPFCLSPVLANAVNVQVEEGYAYSFIALAFVLSVMRFNGWQSHLGVSVLLGVSLAWIYLTKSSYILLAMAFAMAGLVSGRGVLHRLLPLAVVTAAVLGWGLFQSQHAGHFSVGTSLDGINLHKGNHGAFLSLYPPKPGEVLDAYDDTLNRGQFYSSEWLFDAAHKREALAYMQAHPWATFRAMLLKAQVFFLSLQKTGSFQSVGLHHIWETGSLLLFRCVNLAGWVLALAGLVRSHSRAAWRATCCLFLALQLSVAAPYMLGFSYTRHASVLVLPAFFFVALAMAEALRGRLLSTNSHLSA